MRITYLTQWFEPEPNIVKGTSFVRALEAAGHRVTVVTGFPNYPTGRIYPGYQQRPIAHETIAGVRVLRLPLYPSHDRSSLRRSLNFLSFFVSAFLYLTFRRERADLIYAYHPPITVGLAAALAGSVRGTPFLLDVQDLWPETLAATGMAGASRIAGAVGRLCGFVYRRASAIIVQSDGMRDALVARGVPAEKVEVVRNWADAEAVRRREEAPGDGRFRLVYGGNLGRAQALESVVDAAKLVADRRPEVEILVYGDGVEAEALRRRAGLSAADNLRFPGRLSQAEIVDVFQRADALLLHLGDDPLFAITIPSKTQFYLAMGRPIVAGIAGEAAEILRGSGSALVVPPANPAALADAICRMAGLPRAVRNEMGGKGRACYDREFAFARGVARTLAVIEGTHAKRD